jgi:hypothetical protein
MCETGLRLLGKKDDKVMADEIARNVPAGFGCSLVLRPGMVASGKSLMWE